MAALLPTKSWRTTESSRFEEDEMDRKQFTFYDSFAIAAKKLKSKQARCEFYDAICDYALHEIEPDLDLISDAAAMGYALVKPILDASRR